MADCKISEETRAKIAQAWPALLADVEGGALVRDALKAAGVSRGMLRAYIQGDAALRAQWDDAREQSAEAFIDEALDLARSRSELARDDKGELVYGKDGKPVVIAIDAAHARTQIDTLKWAARIRNPRVYSDKAQLDVNVRTVDLTRVIEAANARLAAGRAVGQVIEGQVLDKGRDMLELLR